MKNVVIPAGILLGIILLIGLLIRHNSDPVTRLARNVHGRNGALAALRLADMGRGAEAAVPTLIKALHNENENVRLSAALALGNIGNTAVAPLTSLLSSKDENVRFCALAGLGWIGPEANSAFAAVLKSLDDTNPDIRGKAVHTLALIAKDPEQAAVTLVPCLGDRDRDVEIAASECLVRIGLLGVPYLMATIKKHEEVQRKAVQLLVEIRSGSQ